MSFSIIHFVMPFQLSRFSGKQYSDNRGSTVLLKSMSETVPKLKYYYCTSNLAHLIQYCLNIIDKGFAVDVTVLDFKNAFDLDLHNILINKTAKLNID